MATFWIIVCVIALIIFFWPADRDDTDPPEGRSGLALYVDDRTGCHYLGAPMGGITPRLDAEGSHICEGTAR